ncbi:Protein Nazo [Pseudolycoriella hygida]|uniref:Protein Nazo n=1 Tax=Pseudolycoriella hygida TaxID=35572 RepID=A0A9Q0RYV6_9DIPT|nr:Protein Nazo [Pseudolycoriella hygida]
MTVNTREFFDGVAILTDQRNMRVTMKQSAKGAMICGASSFAGGLVFGPVGLAIGGIIGGLSAWQMSKDEFKSLGEIIKNDLTDYQREQLLQHIMASVRDIEITDIAILLPLLMSTESVQATVLKTVVTYIGRELSLRVVD